MLVTKKIHLTLVSRTGLLLLTLLGLALLPPATCQGPFQNLIQTIMQPINNFFRPVNSAFRGFTNNLFRFGASSNSELRAEGRDKLFPDDCGRQDDGKGKLCFGDPDLCRARESIRWPGIWEVGSRAESRAV